MTTYPTTIKEIKAGLAAGDFTAVALLDHVYAYIEKTDDTIHAFLTLSKETAYEQAKAADERGYGEDAPLLNGVPIAIKDNILTEGILTTAASKMLEHFVPTFDAFVVEKLKEAGAVIVGKTNLDEFAMGSSSKTSYFGVSRNPWSTDRIPGGSSGGSAVSVATRQVPAALGTDTGGSIRNPAALNGLVGLKPTYGTVSRRGAIAFGSSLDQIGPLTLTVEDNALMLEAISGHDEWDSTSLTDLPHHYREKIGQPLKGLRIAYPKEYQVEAISQEIRQKMDQVVEFFKSQGAIVDEVSLPHSCYGINVYYIISSAEAASNLQRYDGIRYGYRSESAQTLEEVYVQTRSEGFGDEVKRRIILGTYSLGEDQYHDFFEKAARVRTLIKQDFEKVFENYDVIMGPVTTSTANRFDDQSDDPIETYVADLLTVTQNLAGLPVMSVPAGFDSKNLPIGLQLAGKAFDEATLYQVAYAYEQAHPLYKEEPTFVKEAK